MLTITYLSSAVDRFTREQLEDLLHDCRTRNLEAQVTGLLLYSGGNFIGTLEGPGDAVEAIMGKVQADPRHTGLMVVHRDEAPRRSFCSWSMGYRHAPQVDDEIPGFSNYLDTGRMVGDDTRDDTRRQPAFTFLRVFREMTAVDGLAHAHVTTDRWRAPRPHPGPP